MPGSNSTDATVSRATFLKRLAASVILANLFVIVLLALSLHQSRIQYEDRAVISTRNLSLVLEKQLVGTIEKVDLALLSVADEIGRQAARGGIDEHELNAYIDLQQARLPELDSLRTTDARGMVRHGRGVASSPRTSIADRDHFILPRDDLNANLVIAKPVFARISKKWSLPLARRINRPDGSFAGVVYANITLENFSRSFSRLDVGRQGSVVLRDGELGLVARYPEFKGAFGAIGQKSVSVEFKQMIQSGQTAGTYLARAPTDNIERTLSYRKISTYPLYINVGFASGDYLAQWRHLVKDAAGQAALFMTVTLLSSWLIYLNWRRGATAVEDLISSKEQIRTLLESTAEAIYGVDLQGCCTFANPACVRLLGYDRPDELLGRRLHDLCHHTHPDGTPFPIEECSIVNSFSSGKCIHVDNGLYWRKDGSRFPMECWSHPQLKNNEVVGAVVTFLDITERKRAEAELKESRQQLLDIIDFLPDATYVIDAEGKVIAWNRATEEMTGFGKAEMLGQRSCLHGSFLWRAKDAFARPP
jgi:PAS domain S-box-containing protein